MELRVRESGLLSQVERLIRELCPADDAMANMRETSGAQGPHDASGREPHTGPFKAHLVLEQWRGCVDKLRASWERDCIPWTCSVAVQRSRAQRSRSRSRDGMTVREFPVSEGSALPGGQIYIMAHH